MHKKSMFYQMLVLYICILAINIISISKKWKILKYISKPLLMIVLLLTYFLEAGEREVLPVLIFLAALIGDVFMMLSYKAVLFKTGIISFLLMHVLYILYFWDSIILGGQINNFIYFILIPYIVFGCLIFRRLRFYLGGYIKLTAAYIIIICLMGFSSILAASMSGAVQLICFIIGSTLFILSDTMLAFRKFTRARLVAGLDMLIYGVAQMLLFIGILS